MKTNFKDTMLSEATKIKNIARLVRTLEHQTDINDHAGAILTLAKELKEKKYIKIMEAIVTIQALEGSLPSGLDTYRYTIYQLMMRQAKKRYSPEDYKLIHGAF